MSEGSSGAPQPGEVEIHLRPHITKYLQVKLNPALRDHTPHGHVILREMLQDLSPSLTLVNSQPPGRNNRAHGKLRIAVQFHDGELTVAANNAIASKAEKQYIEEFCAFVDRNYYQGPASSKQAAIRSFRNLYGIEEDDLPMRTSEIQYYRHECRRGKRPMKKYPPARHKPGNGPGPAAALV